MTPKPSVKSFSRAADAAIADMELGRHHANGDTHAKQQDEATAFGLPPSMRSATPFGDADAPFAAGGVGDLLTQDQEAPSTPQAGQLAGSQAPLREGHSQLLQMAVPAEMSSRQLARARWRRWAGLGLVWGLRCATRGCATRDNRAREAVAWRCCCAPSAWGCPHPGCSGHVACLRCCVHPADCAQGIGVQVYRRCLRSHYHPYPC